MNANPIPRDAETTAQDPDIMRLARAIRCSFEVVEPTTGGVTYVKDYDGMRSITNDAENLVPYLVAKYGDRRIVYRDTEGCWDELVHEHGRFTGFAGWDGFIPG